MSKLGKICYLLMGIFLMGMGVARLVLAFWHEMLFVPLALGGALFIVALIVDRRFYQDFFTMRTTKHGMNMGVLVLLMMALLVGVNFISLRYNKTFDVTREGINSLSDQTIKILAQLDDKIEIKMFYRKNIEKVDSIKARFRKLIQMFEDESPKVTMDFINILKRPDLRKEFKIDKEGLAAFVIYKEKKNKIEDMNEESVTKAIIKVTRNKNKIIYFTVGHGEKDLDGGADQPEGLNDFKDELTDASYEVRTVKLFETGKVPDDAEVLAIIGPQQAFLQPELKAVRDFAKKGGKILIALDPGTHHNLALLTKSFGVEFQNNFILDQIGQMMTQSAATAIGMDYAKENEITKDFPNMMTIFHVSSALKKAEDTDLTVDGVVRAGPGSFVTNTLQGKQEPTAENRGPHTLVMSVKGPAEKGKTSKDGYSSEFQAVIFGDSDFLSNQFLFLHLNRDLALNTMATLTQESELISIRPKQRESTRLVMTRTQFLTMVFTLILPLPILLFSTGGFIWYRRRNA